MPELPEVENVRRTLENLVTGKTIEDVIVTYPKIVKRQMMQKFLKKC